MLNKAIVRKPGKSLIRGLTTANLGMPNYERALEQHEAYTQAIMDCGLEVTVLPADEDYPDSTFVEDTAILTPECAIITNPGAPSRRGEIADMKKVLKGFYSNLEEIKSPGTLEGGDVLAVGTHYYIGISERTNTEGANQLIQILENHGYTGSMIEIADLLHLKTGVSYLENNILLVCSQFEDKSEFDTFTKIIVPQAEVYASNCIWLNGTILIPAGFPITKENILNTGYSVIELEMSEFQKLDGGLSCLSLRF